MVAKIISGKNMRGALNYNEQKVQEGKAECIQANLFKGEASELGFNDKLDRFQDLHQHNTRTKTNTLHISLNFDPGEKLDVDTLNGIARAYMDRIGFGNQPYLVYQHHDAAHPHVHILTTLIQENGKRIPIHYLGKNQSETARKAIEKEFQLVEASGKTKRSLDVRPVDIEKVIYGKSESRRGISNVVSVVTRSYRYSSIPELNAVLGLYNVRAERGKEHSKMFERKGLLYSIIDGRGNCVGIPVKASALYGKPTLAFLEKQFKLNDVLKQPLKNGIRETIDNAIALGVTDKNGLMKVLSEKGIVALFRSNAEGRIYGLTFVDTRRQVVFNGSDLGKSYSASSILSRIATHTDSAKPFRPGFTTRTVSSGKPHAPSQSPPGTSPSGILKGIVTADDVDRSSPEAALRLGKKRRKRRRRSL
ncbi:relaxase/mobilization nuclease domain-containing protein [Chryseolinea lacunae]|uniref:Relaxase/mobilization nuclease domain-containing protein n=1 Tax=Chryseolinea lacunae TaxID=2801331 RepID=A0ABS1KZG6_9BACT|nr:relaxase/mobilization nuclease domain-containing protein [Chryseolinea lacunae]MBL0744854.1 relaxase/mobilization nuclease domain-containing protein [Chryseolinea lacunae]